MPLGYGQPNHFAQPRFRVIVIHDGGTRHKDVRARAHKLLDVREFHAALDFNVHPAPGARPEP